MNDYYPTFAVAQVERTMPAHGAGVPALERKYTRKTAILSKTLMFSLIPVICAAALGILLFKKKRYFAEHLIVPTLLVLRVDFDRDSSNTVGCCSLGWAPYWVCREHCDRGQCFRTSSFKWSPV